MAPSFPSALPRFICGAGFIALQAATVFAQGERSSCSFQETFDGTSIPTGWDIGAQVEQQDANGNGLGTFTDAWIIGNAAMANENGYFPVPDQPAGNTFIMANDDRSACNCAMDPVHLTSSAFDLGMTTAAVMECRVFFDGAFGADSAWVEASTNGGTWDLVQQITRDPGQWQHLFLDLSAYDGSASVQVRFGWSDQGAWASGIALDDVCVRSREAHDLVLAEVFSSDITQDPFDQSVRGIEYAAIPIAQHGSLNVAGRVRNLGMQPLNNIVLQVEVFLDGASQGIFTSDTLYTLDVLDTDTIVIHTPWTPAATGMITMTVSASSSEPEDAPGDETGTTAYSVTGPGFFGNDTWTIKNGNGNGVVEANGSGYLTGIRLEPVVSGSVHAISFLLGADTEEGAQVVGRVLNGAFGELGRTDTLTLTSGIIADGLAGNWTYVDLVGPVGFNSGLDLFAVIEQVADSGMLFIATSGDGPRGHSIHRDISNGTWSFPYATPLVRAHLGQVVLGIEAASSNTVLSIFPNPADDHLVIQGTDPLLSLEVHDLSGRVWYRSLTARTNADPSVHHIDTVLWPTGIYVVTVRGRTKMVHGRVVVIH